MTKRVMPKVIGRGRGIRHWLSPEERIKHDLFLQYVGIVFRERREELGLSIQDVVEWSGLKISTVSLIEQGKKALYLRTAYKLCQALAIPLSALTPEGIFAKGKKTRKSPKLGISIDGRTYTKGWVNRWTRKENPVPTKHSAKRRASWVRFAARKRAEKRAQRLRELEAQGLELETGARKTRRVKLT